MPRSASAPAACTKLRTVEELVKVMQSGVARQDVARVFGEMIGRHGAVSLHDIDVSAAAGEFVGHEVARDGGARKQDVFAGKIVSGEGFEERFGDVLFAHQVHFDVQRFDGGARGRSDGADFGAQLAEVVEMFEEEANAVGAGEDQPVVGVEIGRWRDREARGRRAGGFRWWAVRSRRRRAR